VGFDADPARFCAAVPPACFLADRDRLAERFFAMEILALVLLYYTKKFFVCSGS
jgi:hypothetical protein